MTAHRTRPRAAGTPAEPCPGRGRPVPRGTLPPVGPALTLDLRPAPPAPVAEPGSELVTEPASPPCPPPGASRSAAVGPRPGLPAGTTRVVVRWRAPGEQNPRKRTFSFDDAARALDLAHRTAAAAHGSQPVDADGLAVIDAVPPAPARPTVVPQLPTSVDDEVAAPRARKRRHVDRHARARWAPEEPAPRCHPDRPAGYHVAAPPRGKFTSEGRVRRLKLVS